MNKKELISKLDLQNVNENSTDNEIENAIRQKINHYHKLLELENENTNELKELIVNFEKVRIDFLNNENPIQVNSVDDLIYKITNEQNHEQFTEQNHKQFTVSKFKKEYCEIIQTDTNGKRFIKIPVNDYVELNMMRNNLINAIDLIIQAHEYNLQDESLSYTIQNLTKILQATSLNYESEGIDKLIAI